MDDRRRRALLDDYYGLVTALDGDASPSAGLAASTPAELERRASDLRREYVEGLPPVPLSRCPLTGDPVHITIDTDGLDGLWWNHRSPSRPIDKVPDSFLLLTGAVRLGAPPEPAPFLAIPGPEVPYVVPRILEVSGVVGVVSSVSIGRHTGYAITYFTLEGPPPGVALANSWGAAHYWVTEVDGERTWGSEPEWEDDVDFELGPWLEAGKLWWIAPGDGTLTLRDDADCPYVGLEGRREYTRIRDGEAWWRSDVLSS